MKRPRMLKEELLHYLKQEWRASFKEYPDGLWLTTRAFQLRLRERGVFTTWPTLAIKLNALLNSGLVERINSTNGECWRPRTDIIEV